MEFNNVNFDTYFKNYPDENGFFGKYGGAYVSPELQKAMVEINDAYPINFSSFNNYYFFSIKQISKPN